MGTPAVTCARCGRGVRGQARKRALYFGETAICSQCERSAASAEAKHRAQQREICPECQNDATVPHQVGCSRGAFPTNTK